MRGHEPNPEKFTEQMRRPFEDSVGATLALDLDRNSHGYYLSNKTANLFIAFCYGCRRGEGDCRSFASFMQELAELRLKIEYPTTEAKPEAAP